MRKKIGLYFGSFNPITKAHEKIALYVINHTSIDEMHFLISPQNPHKEQKDLLNVDTRCELIEVVCEGHNNLKLNLIELSLPIPSYTAHTLKMIGEQDKLNEYYVIMGYDVFKSIHEWHDYKEVLNYPIILLPRETNDNDDEFITHKKELEKKVKHTIVITYLQEMKILPISSTEVRTKIQNNENIADIVNPKVLKIINEKKLYQNGENRS
jgi:nicotinate-nucleotide adenylyltransferase